MKKTATGLLKIICLFSLATIASLSTHCALGRTPELALPSPKQIRFADWEIGGFIHFGMNPFTDQEHGNGLEPPDKFNPADLDVAHRGMNRDKDYRGGVIEIDGSEYKHGMLLCPTKGINQGIAEFDMTRGPQAKAKSVKAVLGIEDMTNKAGSVEFIVEGFVDGAWETLFQSPRITGASKPLHMHVSFPEGMEQLRLKTTHGGDNCNSDHAVWADAQFLE